MRVEPTVEFWSHPDMPYVETRRACQSRICYKSHSHPSFSIGAVDAGKSHFSSYFSDHQLIEAGSLVIIPAHVEHSCNPLPDQVWSYQMMHLDAVWVSKLVQELHQQFLALSVMVPIPQIKPSVIQNPETYHAFTHLNQVLFDLSIPILEKEQYLITVLTEILLPHFDWKNIIPSHYFQQYLPHLLECLETGIDDLSLAHLSEKMNISRYALIRLFKQYFGLTPHAYQLNYKVNQARQRLRQGCDIAQLAYDLEFTDQSHFHRVFKRHTGITPKQYYKKS